MKQESMNTATLMAKIASEEKRKIDLKKELESVEKNISNLKGELSNVCNHEFVEGWDDLCPHKGRSIEYRCACCKTLMYYNKGNYYPYVQKVSQSEVEGNTTIIRELIKLNDQPVNK